MKETVWMTRAVQPVVLQAAAKCPAIYIPWLLITASKVFTSGDIHLALKDLIQPDAPGLKQDQWDNKWWLALAPQQEDNAPVEGKGKGEVTKQLMEVLIIKVLPMKVQKWAGVDEESDNGEEEAEGSRSISKLIFQLWEDHLAVHPSHPVTATNTHDGSSTPAGMEQEGNEDPIMLNPTTSPPHKKAHHVQVRSPSPLTLAPGPVPSTSASTSTSQLTPTGGTAYVLLDTFQQVLVWEQMTQLEQEMAEMTTTMHHWQDNFVADYLELNGCIMAMEENQWRFINWPLVKISTP
ncbi:hypothetical protein ID866_9128 [Astraeus odoratus]|nr:hypothetical protein ID866_9128 [Astraeus odoratus]